MKTPEQIAREVFDLHWRDMTTTQIAVEAVKADRAQRTGQSDPEEYGYTPAEIAQSRARLVYNRETRNVDSRGVPFSSVMDESAYMGPTTEQERYVTEWGQHGTS